MNDINIYDVVMKLVGNIHPVGETTADNFSYDNLKQLTELTDSLLFEINTIAMRYRASHEYSVKRASDHCSAFLLDVRGECYE